ncbi:hypothetical protein F5Y16DRAFT_411184 [Xylariaceae sp. FL0255]|nr:hypothetical protein F5Y16DRAFT_411184 [Xylariaceae sp. FL0255]
MSRRGLLGFAHLVVSVVPYASAVALNYNSTCHRLQELYGSKVSLPTTAEYDLIAPGQNYSPFKNWSEAAQLSPSCIFEPSDSQDVAGALAILVQDGAKFAVRGGGHMPVPGASNINQGVLISMNSMNTTQLTHNNSIVQLGPGLTWLSAYQYLSDYDLMVAGGRFATVGVAGLLLGGGISYFGSQTGWATNQVANFEVVLANSTIVNANAGENQDLFWALKGGSSNYGIVTRFDVKTFPQGQVYGGEVTFSSEYLDEIINAEASYSVVGGGVGDIEGAYNIAIEAVPATGDVTVFGIFFRNGTDTNPAAFANFSRVPKLSDNSQVWPNLGEALASTTVFGARTQRQLFMGSALQATKESVFLANTTFFKLLDEMPELASVKGLQLVLSPQPISKSFLEAARASGGDPMDVEPGNGKMLPLIGSSWDNEADDATVYEFSQRFIAALERDGKAMGVYYPFVYLNDAYTSEKPFDLYGQGKSLGRLKAIRDAYDPHRIFQTLLPGGFKLG